MTKKTYSIENDPNKIQEAQKYDNPIPSRQLILTFLQDAKYPVLFDSIAKALALYKDSQLEALSNRLSAMVRDEQLKQNGNYFRPYTQVDHIVKGKVYLQNDGTAKVVANDQSQSAFLPQHQAKIVFDGDIICACVIGINRKNKLEARIDSIVKRNTKNITGRYFHYLDTHIVQPVSKTMPKNILLTPPPKALEPNTLISADIVIQPSEYGPAVAAFNEVIQEESPILTAIAIASQKHNLVEEWSLKTKNAVKKLPKKVEDKEIKTRIDLRDFPFVTIDGEDAKDFDDAVFARKSTTGGWKLYVAIADVSYYVRPTSALDHEAQMRSTSVYFPGYVIPMLPEALSNELCSLKPKVDRLSLVCEMNVSKTGKLTRYKFYSAVINSKARLTYTEVDKLFKHKDTSIYYNQPEVIPHLFDLYDLYQALAKRRQERGAIDFDTIETQIILDEHKHISSIIPRHRNDAHRLIEECMLLTNVATARFIEKNKIPAPFRVHQAPPESKVKELKSYLRSLGITFTTSKDGVQPQDYAQMLESAKTRADFHNIQLMTLKSMNQAVYTPDNAGHFGLAYDAYTHFTSPIRRYPDLITHRVIKYILKEKSFGSQQYTQAQLDQICTHASGQERNADSASMDVEKWLKCHFLQDRIGDLFEAKIVHITGFGMFVELLENYIEGLVHIASMQGDFYVFDEIQHKLIGQRTKKTFSLGQKVQVQLIRADMEGGHIDFELTENGKGRSNFESYEPSYRQKPNKPRRPFKKRAKKSTTARVTKERDIEVDTPPKDQASKKKKTKRRSKMRKKTNAKNKAMDN
ncbi:ribonuclease R [Facilibium subflavum]|uniref:ribonuclease R n=1 Tax=Facilibium subflavum TaxID=2219058 RepID=UPI000E653A07|nr:ribonuclease R [Facilibium subflavum]